MKKKERVVAAMSGGVDSSVVAALLLEEGYDVIGATLMFKPSGDQGDVQWCCGNDAVESAKSVAQTLGISHHVINCPAEFEDTVLRPSWKEYTAGRTPNPCIWCNYTMKFGVLPEWGKQHQATKIATGHYVQVAHMNGHPALCRGLDHNKDQSYFLFSLSEEQLKTSLFPLGKTSKDKVREMAKALDLSSAERPDSQDACFVLEDGGFSSALATRYGDKLGGGQVLNSHGEVIGKHAGVHLYTIGQRKGLKIPLGKKAYVSNINAKDSTITLSDTPEDLLSKKLIASNIIWSPAGAPKTQIKCDAQIRYGHTATPATVTLLDDNKIQVIFDEPQRAVAPGQSVVLYNGVCVLGGGWIESAHS